MKTYLVKASYVSYVYAEIEAENEEEAWKKAYDLDGNDFQTEDELSWQYDAMIELESDLNV